MSKLSGAALLTGLLLTACATGPVAQASATSAAKSPVSAPRTAANLAPASAIIRQSDAALDAADWGTFYSYFSDDTHGLSPVLVGVAKIEAGQQIHHPHRHADEEYLMVTRGQGTWTLNNVDSPANVGDILFARAWDYHGIRASEDGSMEFVVFKYSARAMKAPVNPHPDWPKEKAVRPR
jgi:quercetin dioxygenase-like cupin family protein